jgi:hypothetical protein
MRADRLWRTGKEKKEWAHEELWSRDGSDKGADYYEQKYRNQQLQFLRKKAAQLGFQLTEAEAQTA